MQTSSKPNPARRIAGFAAAAILAIFGIASIVKGLEGQSTVRTALQQEKVVGTPTMTPAAFKAEAQQRGVAGVAAPTCSVAGKQVTSGAEARCFAEYMRADALLATGGKTYAEMPRFATKDGKGTGDAALAEKLPNGQPMNNPARQVWVTATTMSTALNTSYMAEQVSLFGIAVGAAFLLLGLVLAVFAAAGMKVGGREPKASRSRQVAEPSAG